ncbi:MAG: B12-binding domain-containing radical SAM protein [Candidatus Glassbacteria bacterium]
MKILIGYPPLSGKGSPMLTQNRQFQWYHVPAYIFPLVPASAATLLSREGFDVIWADGITERANGEEYRKMLTEERPDIAAFETKTPVIQQHWEMIDRFKDILPSTKFALMGDHVTALPEESFQNSKVDFVITGGHYDFLLLGIARHLSQGVELPPGIYFRDGGSVQNTGPFEVIQDLNSLPFIDRKLTKAHMYFEKWKRRDPFMYTMAGRDCPWGKCTFCAWTTIHPQFSVRTPESLLDEIGFLIEEHGVREIFDDTGNFPGGSWLRKFCEGMIERGYNEEILFSCNMRFSDVKPKTVELMKKAGFRKIKSGLESANQETLDRISKGIRVEDIVNGCRIASEAGLEVQLTIMVGYPWETRKQALKTLELARSLMSSGAAEMLQSTVVVPYPGTKLYQEALDNDWFRIDPREYNRYDMTETVLKMPDMEPEDVIKICGDIYKTFLTPKFVLRNMSKIRSWEDASYLLRGAKAVVGHILDFVKIRS